MQSPEDLLTRALQAHEAGDFDTARDAYRQLREFDDNPEVLHMAGLVEFQCASYDEAASLIGAAVEGAPENAVMRSNLGLALAALGRDEDALTCFRAAVQIDPAFADAYINLGNADLRAGRAADAIETFREALAHSEPTATLYNNLGVALRANGQEDEAGTELRNATATDPKHFDAWTNLATHYEITDRPVEAADAIERACDLDFDDYAVMIRGVELLEAADRVRDAERILLRHAICHPDDGHVLADLGSFYHRNDLEQLAMTVLEQAVQRMPESAEVHNNLGALYHSIGREDEARAQLQQAIGLAPEYVDALTNLAIVCEHLREFTQAEQLYLQASQLGPPSPILLRALGVLYYKMQDRARMSATLERHLELYPDDIKALHMYQAASQKAVPARASDGFVQGTFDSFARDYDNQLAGIGYLGPQILAAALDAHGPDPNQECAVLDAGCGTGLCAPVLRPYAKLLVGVDLSAGMLSQADKRGLYDELHEQELHRFLEAQQQTWQLVTIVDTLVYVGDLAGVFAGLSGTLSPGGISIFTVEAGTDDTPKDYALSMSGRYQHSDTYIRQLARANGLQVIALEDVHLRMELGKPVEGYCVTLAAMPAT